MARQLRIQSAERVIGGFRVTFEQTEAYTDGRSDSFVRLIETAVFLNADGSARGRAQVRNAITTWLAQERAARKAIEGATLNGGSE